MLDSNGKLEPIVLVNAKVVVTPSVGNFSVLTKLYVCCAPAIIK